MSTILLRPLPLPGFVVLVRERRAHSRIGCGHVVEWAEYMSPRPRGGGSGQPVMLCVPVSMWPVARRLQLESLLTVTVKSYQPPATLTALK